MAHGSDAFCSLLQQYIKFKGPQNMSFAILAILVLVVCGVAAIETCLQNVCLNRMQQGDHEECNANERLLISVK